MKQTTIGLLAFGLLLCATAARAQEKTPVAPAADPLAAHWSTLRNPWQPLKNNKEWAENRNRAIEELAKRQGEIYKDRKSTRLNSSHIQKSRMPSSA